MLIAAVRQAEVEAGIENAVACSILNVEMKRRQTFQAKDWPFTTDDWPGATADELDTVRLWFKEAGYDETCDQRGGWFLRARAPRTSPRPRGESDGRGWQ